MCGKYYGVYDLKRDEACVGIFESTAEIAAHFGGIRKHRISKGIMQKHLLTFGSDRYFIKVFKEATLKETRRLLRQRFGERMYKITDNGIYIRQTGQSWQYFAADYDEAVTLAQ